MATATNGASNGFNDLGCSPAMANWTCVGVTENQGDTCACGDRGCCC